MDRFTPGRHEEYQEQKCDEELGLNNSTPHWMGRCALVSWISEKSKKYPKTANQHTEPLEIETHRITPAERKSQLPNEDEQIEELIQKILTTGKEAAEEKESIELQLEKRWSQGIAQV